MSNIGLSALCNHSLRRLLPPPLNPYPGRQRILYDSVFNWHARVLSTMSVLHYILSYTCGGFFVVQGRGSSPKGEGGLPGVLSSCVSLYIDQFSRYYSYFTPATSRVPVMLSPAIGAKIVGMMGRSCGIILYTWAVESERNPLLTISPCEGLWNI